MEEEMPDLLEMTNDFRQVVYKMYLLGKFKHERCEPEFETDQSVTNDSVTLTTGGQYRVDVGDGEVVTDGSTIYQSTSPQYDAGQTLTDRQALEVATRWEKQQHQRMKDATPRKTDYSMGGVSTDMPGVRDTSTTTTTDTTVDADLEEDEAESLKKRFASKLCERAGLR